MVSAVSSVVAAILGVVSAFSLFAMAFNGYGWNYFAVVFVMIAVISAIVGKFFVTLWYKILFIFMIPYLFFFGLLIMAGIEKGGWQMILPLIAIMITVIWLPAFVISKFNKS